MTDFYSDHFEPLGTGSEVTVLDSQHRPGAGIAGGAIYHDRARISLSTAFLIADVARLFSLPSGARLIRLLVTGDGGSTAGAVDIGLYESGSVESHDGVAIDATLFASALTTSAAIARVDQFVEAGTLGDADRGKRLWQLADIGAGSYSEDPFEKWDVCLTATTAFTVAATELIVEAEYKLNHG